MRGRQTEAPKQRESDTFKEMGSGQCGQNASKTGQTWREPSKDQTKQGLMAYMDKFEFYSKISSRSQRGAGFGV